VLGGEPVQVARLASLREPRPLFINSYGPTECSDVVGWHVLSADLATYTSQGVPLGKPVRNTSLYALDRALQPVPIGVTGEVYIAGVQVGRGYLNRPAPTAERFLPDPFGPAGARMYRTGDLGRWRADGLFEFLGRNDHQVKLRGFRIELGEIEAALMNVPGVKAALVLARELAGMEKRLVACCGLSDPAQNEESIRASLRARLPDYMIPQHFVLLDDLPLTSNGKVDRARLLALDVPQPRSKQVAPRTLLESHLCEVWQDALDLDEVGVTDNIFALGGDSMRVVRLVRRAAARGIFIHVRDIFACQTVAELSRFVTANLGTVTRRDQPAPLQVLAENFSSAPYIQADVEDCYPATSMQQLMWTMSRHPSAGDGVYQPQMLFELNDIDLSVDTLTAALGYLIDKHPTLRTRFVEAPDGQLVQLVFSHLDPRLPSLDLTAMPESEQERHIRELILADAQQRFQLGQPAIRLAVLKLTQRRWGLLISCHHAIEDGWGFIELNNELLALYDSLARGESLPARQARANVFKEYVALQMEARKSALHRQAWQELLRGYQPMPALAPGPLARLAITSVPMRADLIRQLKQQAARNDASMKAIFLLAWLRALARVLRTDVVTVDIVSSGRSARLSDPFGAVGLFWSFMPVCSAGIMDDPSPLRALTARLSAVDTHALYPVDAIAEIAVPRGEPLTYAAFNFVHFHNQKTAAQSGWTCAPRYASDRFHHALKLIVSVHPAQTLARLECDRRYVDETRQEALGRFLEQELETLSAAAPGDGQYSAT
jgi:aryl carrier-like protein